MNLTAALLLTIGAVSLVAGVTLWSIPAGLVIAGLLLGAAGYLSLDVAEDGGAG